MNTSRSDKLATEFLARKTPFKREIQTYQQVFDASPEAVFRQLCPSREADWIDGWTADLIWTTSGYAEEDCIFTTTDANPVGPGLWVITRLEPNRLLQVVRIIGSDVVFHLRIDVADNQNGTCTGTWTLKFTALTQQGNVMVQSLPEQDPDFGRLILALDHYLRTGEMMRRQ